MVILKEMPHKIESRVIVEVVGKPKEHVEEAIKGYVEKIKSDNNFKVLSTEFGCAEPVEGELFSTFVELEMTAKEVQSFVDFCFDYMPSSIEIIKPESVTLTSNDVSNILNDLQAKLHNVDLQAKETNQENLFLKSNTKAILTNFISILLLNAERNSEDLSKITGIAKDDIEVFLEALEKENKVQKIGDTYTLKNVKREKQS